MKDEDNKRNYYAVIPASVRYHPDVTPNAKLLFGEITALCNEKGYCWASNSYFADLYGVSKSSISNWITQLRKNNFIEVEIIYKEGTREIKHRYIKLLTGPILNIYNRPMTENCKDNNTSINTTVNNNKLNKYEVPTFGDFRDYALRKKPDVDKMALKLKYESWVENDWKDGNDKEIKNWKSKLLNTLPHMKTQEKKKKSDPFRNVSF